MTRHWSFHGTDTLSLKASLRPRTFHGTRNSTKQCISISTNTSTSTSTSTSI